MALAGLVARRIRRWVRGGALDLPPSVIGLAGTAASIVPLDYTRHDVRLLVTSEMERRWRTRAAAKEPWTIAWLEESMSGGGVLYDVGANVGAFSLVAAKLAGTRGTVVAFEPGFASYAHLCSNIVLNGCQATVVPVSLALGSANGVSGFAYRSLDPGQSRHEFRQGRWSAAEADLAGRYVQPVLSMTLDDAVTTFALPPPNHLKIDVDGGELGVLDGAARTLRTPGLESVLIEIDRTQSDQVTARLAASGLTLDRTHDRAHGGKAETNVWYGVFRRAPVSRP